ncbi:MAG: hypothetical protein PQJ59_01725 [Spirochaetales bacterium]|nr:hypothetical protein [Spirochaetales bacterium]
MRRVEYWETEEEHNAGKHYQLIVQSDGDPDGCWISGKLLLDDSTDSVYGPEFYSTDEKAGIFDMMRELFWKIKDLPGMESLIRRMHCLAYADYDSEVKGAPAPISFGDVFAKVDKLTALVEEVKAEREAEADQIVSALSETWEEIREGIEVYDPFFIPKTGPQLDLFGLEA